jgi:hypothetical protein
MERYLADQYDEWNKQPDKQVQSIAHGQAATRGDQLTGVSNNAIFKGLSAPSRAREPLPPTKCAPLKRGRIMVGGRMKQIKHGMIPRCGLTS